MTLKNVGLADFTAQIISVVTTSNSLKPYYDRNPLTVGIAYDAGAVAPHSQTQRAIYTVPASRKAKVSSSFCHIMRVTAAAPASYTDIRIKDGSGRLTNFCKLRSNGVGDKDSMFKGNEIELLAGQTIEIDTEDYSTGGTVDYLASIFLTEFDA